ncbi:MAG: ribonuclease H-like domain-containing protein [Eubacterium sp.]
MLVIKDKANTKITYPIEKIADQDKVLFFDIETTGFSRKYCNVYLIGCMYFSGDQPMYTQWLAENFNDEANVLMAFHKFIQSFDTIIHFNGNSFDMPFLQARGEKYHLDFNFDQFKSIDIYRPVSKMNHILKMENQKQKTFEQLLGIKRTDPFSGGDLIEVFKHYVESKDERLIFPLLLHNREDVWNMGELISLLSISDLFHYKFHVLNYKIRDFKNMNGDIEQELCMSLELENTLPTPISYNFNGIYLRVNNTAADISIQIKKGTYKYFFDNYKDYYYLPLEDKAIHKSVAGFVDKKYRKQATPAICYEKFSGSFLPVYQMDNNSFAQLFKESHKDKTGFIKVDFINSSNIYDYACMLLEYLKEKPKYS